jgi:hypothetical protein
LPPREGIQHLRTGNGGGGGGGTHENRFQELVDGADDRHEEAAPYP